MVDLTVIVPGIRTYNWVRLYESIFKATNRSWEMIFIGPTAPPVELSDRSNIKYIKDYGTPIRCQQIGLQMSEGKWITWAADDGYFLDGSLDIGFNLLDARGQDENIVLMGKYFEGDGNESTMSDLHYYRLSSHPCTSSPYIPQEFYILNVGLVARSLLEKFGGWDCQFEVCPMSYADLAFRLQNAGTEFIVQDEVMFKCSHMPNDTGDHGPVHFAQLLNDEPLYRRIYSSPDCLSRPIPSLDNWKQSPSIWKRRFHAGT